MLTAQLGFLICDMGIIIPSLLYCVSNQSNVPCHKIYIESILCVAMLYSTMTNTYDIPLKQQICLSRFSLEFCNTTWCVIFLDHAIHFFFSHILLSLTNNDSI